MNEPIELGPTTSIEILKQQVDLADQLLLDVGCGSYGFTRPLLDAGARVIGVDPDPIQAAKNRSAPPIDGLTFYESGGEELPCESDSCDGVVFSFSLHHIDKAFYPKVYDEVIRVLKPDGFLCVIEPVECPLNEVMRLFHNEDAVRQAAQDSLKLLAVPRFKNHAVFHYHSYREYGDFERFAEHYANQSFNELYTREDVTAPEVREAFERLAEPGGRFFSPKMMFLGTHPLHSQANS